MFLTRLFLNPEQLLSGVCVNRLLISQRFMNESQ